MRGSANYGRRRGNDVTFRYSCECADCDEAGTLTIKADEHGTIACPGGCGAVYYPWFNPLSRRWELKAVVMPVYGAPA